MNNIDISVAKSYASEANLDKALARTGLDSVGCRYMKVRNAEGRWTAIFLVSEYARHNGGYIGFAAQHGFMSV